MKKGLRKFCRDVDKLTASLGEAEHFNVDVPRVGDHLILIRDNSVILIEVVDVVLSSVEGVCSVTAVIKHSPVLAICGQVVTGIYSSGASQWSGNDHAWYRDYRLFIRQNALRFPVKRFTGKIRRVILASNAAITIALTQPTDPALFQQVATVHDTFRWSASKRHIFPMISTVMNAGLSLSMMLIHQPIAAMVTAACSLLCFLCLHVVLRRTKKQRDKFLTDKAGLDDRYNTIKRRVEMFGLTEVDRDGLRMAIMSYCLLGCEVTHLDYQGVLKAWAGRIDQFVDEQPADMLFNHIDRFRDALVIPE